MAGLKLELTREIPYATGLVLVVEVAAYVCVAQHKMKTREVATATPSKEGAKPSCDEAIT